MNYTIIQSYWQSKAELSCYMTDYKWMLERLRLGQIQQIDLLIALDSDGNYTTTYCSNEKQSALPIKPKTIQELSLWLIENNLVLSELDITLDNNVRLRSYYGGDLVMQNLPQGLFDDLNDFGNFKDFTLYQSNSSNNWQPVERNIHSIIDFLECNEDIFYTPSDLSINPNMAQEFSLP